MKHYVYLKLAAGYSAGELICRMERVLTEAQNTLPGFEQYQVLTEPNPNTEPLSVLIVLKFVSCAEKDNYLQHPLHLALLRQVKPAISEKAVFDDED